MLEPPEGTLAHGAPPRSGACPPSGHRGASLAVPVLDDGRVLILRQYRFAVATRLLEFPAGTLDPGETPLVAMRGELEEEAGYRAERWDPLGVMLPCKLATIRFPVRSCSTAYDCSLPEELV
jgi:8-oxo-dGTP pyrophosphatase MutT (NUDIX family)